MKRMKVYNLPITHMRQKLSDKELVMCLGAGINKCWQIPNWNELIERIAKNKNVNGNSILRSDVLPTTKAQALYELFKKNYPFNNNINEIYRDYCIQDEWVKLIHNELYRTSTRAQIEHPYIDEYIHIIKKSPITINYNFDDLIEQNIRESRGAEFDERNYESVWLPSLHFKKNNAVIYHPNGFLPEHLSEGYSEDIIFNEKSFQDQLFGMIMGHYNSLQYLFSRYTLLLLGLSMEDQSLRHLLRQNARLNPGHFHYYVYYKKKGFKMSLKAMKSLQESYFDTFNLIVLFLDDTGIKNLGKLLNMKKEDFDDNVKHWRTAYNYYITGAPGTGKTTTLNYLSNYNIFNEWPDIMPENLNKADDLLSEKERSEVDNWITKQFSLKNNAIYRKYTNDDCVQIIDRSPLDPITFAKSIDKSVERAQELKCSFKKYNMTWKKLMSPGKLILFTANKDIILQRLNKRNPNQYKEDWVEKKIKQFNELYKNNDIIVIDTSTMNVPMMVKTVMHEIYFGKYKEINLDKYLNDYCLNKRKIIY